MRGPLHAEAIERATRRNTGVEHGPGYLSARGRRPGLPVVRLASPGLSAHVAARHDALAASSVAIAGEAFAQAALAACHRGTRLGSSEGI